MFSFFRRLSKSAVGSMIMVLFVVLILASFAMGDIANIGSGNLGLGGGSSLAKAGSQQITDRDMSRAMERRLTQIRQQNPAADYGAIAGDFDPLLDSLLDQTALQAFADKNGFVLSKRLIDAEIARIPGTRGLDGKFSEQAYRLLLAQQRTSDQELRQLIAQGLLQRMLLTPVATSARVPVGMATPYASMLMEAREADIQLIPTARFLAGIPAPTDADIATYYRTNARAYTIPEQRVINVARIGPAQVAAVVPTDKEVADYYKANQATYGA